jgi:hypothetical protein
MSIQVRSNEAPAPEVKPQAEAPKEAHKSAPESPSEHKSATESEPVEAEAKEDHEEESEGESQADGSEGDKPKKKGGFQRRIDKLNSRISERERELDYWKQLALKDKQAEPKKETQVERPKTEAEGKPDAGNFDTHAEYVEALTEWKIEQREKAREQQAQQSKLKDQQQQAVKSHQDRVKTFAESVKDFQDTLEQVDDVQVSPVVQELIISSENGPELMYELAKNREGFERINKLPPLAAARALGRIESKLASHDSQPEIKKTTKAPKPIGPVGTGGKGSGTSRNLDDPSISQAEYERLRREQLKRK